MHYGGVPPRRSRSRTTFHSSPYFHREAQKLPRPSNWTYRPGPPDPYAGYRGLCGSFLPQINVLEIGFNRLCNWTKSLRVK